MSNRYDAMNFDEINTRINALRVAQAELSSGNIQGKEVFLRLSEGAVAFPVERETAKTMVSSELQQALLGEMKVDRNASSNSKKAGWTSTMKG